MIGGSPLLSSGPGAWLVSLSGIDIHSRAAPLYWSAGHPAAWRLAFLSQAGSFLRENAAVPCPASNVGVPINVEASAKPDACLPAFLRKATPGLQETWRGSLSLFFFFFSRPGLQEGRPVRIS